MTARKSAVPAAPFGPAAPLYTDAHRALATELEAKLSPSDSALHDKKKVIPRLAELGLLVHLDNRRTGRLDIRALSVAREALAYVSPLADSIYAVQGLALNALAGDENKAGVVDALVKGTKVGAFALTEPEAGSDVAAMASAAHPSAQGAGVVLTGEKVYISNVGIADFYVVFAHSLDEVAAEKLIKVDVKRAPISAYMVAATSEGLTLEALPMSVDHPLGRLKMEACAIGQHGLVGARGEGMRRALGTLDIFRTSVGAAANGMARRAIDETVARVSARFQFGRALAEQQLVQASLADMVMDLEAAQLLVAATAHAKDADPQMARGTSGRRVATAKIAATEAAQRIIDRAVQLHGGWGVTGALVEQLYREIRPLRIYEGATDVLKLVVASDVLSYAEPAGPHSTRGAATKKAATP